MAGGIIKFTNTSYYDFGVEPVSIIKDGLKPLVKTAGVAVDKLKYEKTKGQTDVHIIALGDEEHYAENRNKDSFLAKDCRERHDTFVKSDRAVHKHHKNKPADPKYGNIKASCYNEKMGRIELVVGIDEHGGGADILDEIEKKGEAAFSMCSVQPYDVCSICGHKAYKNERKARCRHINDELGEVTKEGKATFMRNISPSWREISYVHRPADRIAYSLDKLAHLSAFTPISTAEYLRQYPGFDDMVVSKTGADKRDLLRKLSEIEKRTEAIGKKVKADGAEERYIKDEAPKAAKSELSDATIDELRKMDPDKLLPALADAGIVLNPRDFSKYLFDKRVSDHDVSGMCSHLPSIFRDMFDDGDTDLNDETFDGSEGGLPPGIRKMVQRLMPDMSLFGEHARPRVIRVSISSFSPIAKEKMEKTSSAFHHELAKAYGLYKLSALRRVNAAGRLTDEVIFNALAQNNL